jgi:hypothetical protein
MDSDNKLFFSHPFPLKKDELLDGVRLYDCVCIQKFGRSYFEVEGDLIRIVLGDDPPKVLGLIFAKELHTSWGVSTVLVLKDNYASTEIYSSLLSEMISKLVEDIEIIVAVTRVRRLSPSLKNLLTMIGNMVSSNGSIPNNKILAVALHQERKTLKNQLNDLYKRLELDPELKNSAKRELLGEIAKWWYEHRGGPI